MPGERELANEAAATSRNERETLERLLALGLCAFYKWDRVFSAEEKSSAVDPAQHIAIAESFTDREIRDYKHNATRALDEYVRSYLRAQHTDSWWYGVWQGVASAFLYSILLVGFALIFKVFGSDFGTILQFIFTTPGTGH